MLSKIKKIIPIIGIIILLYLVVNVGALKIIDSMLGASVMLLFTALLMVPPYLILQTYKWQYIIRKQGIDLGFAYLLKVYVISTFWSIITPGKLGTFSRIAYIKKTTGKDLGESGSGVVLDKVVDMFALFILAISGGFLLARYLSSTVLIAMIGLFVIFMVGSGLLMKKDTSRVIMKLVYRFIIPRKMKSDAHQSFHSFYRSVPPMKYLIIPFIVTFISWVVICSGDYFIALSLGISVPWHIFVTLFPIATIIGLIPITIGGWGTREATLIGLLAPFAASAESVIALSLLAFIFILLPPAALGAVLSFFEK